jgi:hypothetical protein
VQKLTGHIVVLNRFIVKLAERNLQFFAVLRGSAPFEWGPEQQKAFDDLKAYVQEFAVLLSLEQGQPLILYVSALHTTMNGALVQEREVTKKSCTRFQYTLYPKP